MTVMTPLQIFERLRDEFPGRHVSFELEVTTYQYNVDYPNVTMKIWCADGQISIPCASLDEGIASLKSRLGMGMPEMELVV